MSVDAAFQTRFLTNLSGCAEEDLGGKTEKAASRLECHGLSISLQRTASAAEPLSTSNPGFRSALPEPGLPSRSLA